MPAISIVDLNNAKVDADHIADVANSTAPTATDRMGHTKKTITGVLDDAETRVDGTVTQLETDAQASMVEIVDNIGNHHADTYALLTEIVSPKPGAGGIVDNDPNPNLDGWYRKTGAAGAAGWARIPDQPVSSSRSNSVSELLLDSAWLADDVFITNAGFANDWFSPLRKNIEAAKAIKSVVLYGENPNTDYHISVFANNDTTYGDRISITDGTNTVLTTSNALITKNPNGLTRVVIQSSEILQSGMQAELLIDYRQLTTQGTLVVDVRSPLRIAKTSYSSAQRRQQLERDLPNWIRADYRAAVLDGNEHWLNAISAVRGLTLDGADPAKTYRVTVVGKGASSYGSRIMIADSDGANIAWHNTLAAAPRGLTRVVLTERDGSGVTGVAHVNWDLFPGNTTVSLSTSNAVIDLNAGDIFEAPRRIAALEQSGGQVQSAEASHLPERAYRFALAGSSITWGTGYLGEESLVGIVEDELRSRFAKTIVAAALAPSAPGVAGKNFYKGSVRRLAGVNSAVSFDMFGDELNVSLVRERGNAGAALIDLYVDDVLHDTFSTYNDEPFGTRTRNFTGNGTDVKFDLGECFTYGHAVTVGGSTLTGGMNTQLSGASIPVGWDYMVVRTYSPTLNAVTHTAWFRNAPANGAAISATYSYGETIAHMRGTLGNTGVGIDTPLESAFGDGGVSEDTTQPAAVSSGLGFRESDPRSVVTFGFGSRKTRNFRLVVRALDPRGSGTPRLDLNFVTNRMHHIQNAGIGGWTADLFLTSDVLINRIDQVAQFQPDVLLLESATNDDWAAHVSRGHIVRSGLTNVQVMDVESSNYYNTITGASNSKTVTDDRIPIAAVTANSITLDSAAVVTVAPSDAIIIGSFHLDHRRVAVRLVDTYDAGTKTVTFKREIRASEFAQVQVLTDLVGDWVMLKSAPTWQVNVQACVDAVRAVNPGCAIHLATAGQPNYHHRRLFGYLEFAQAMAQTNGWGVVDYYGATGVYQYSQPNDGRVYIGAGASTTSTGASSYPLLSAGGGNPVARFLHKLRVVVDGVDRTNRGCHFEGGYAYRWATGVTDPTMSNGRTLQVWPYRLMFTADIPPAGSTVEVYFVNNVWSSDDTHPGRVDRAIAGTHIFGHAAAPILNEITR